MRRNALMALLMLVIGAITVYADDYPSAPSPHAPPTGMIRNTGQGCETCPWGRPELGPYPAPFNAPKSYAPVHRGEYFDIYGHWIETHYSEVFWTAQPAVPLPADLVSNFAGRAISFTGFEVDVVSGGENNETEWSVPEFQAPTIHDVLSCHHTYHHTLNLRFRCTTITIAQRSGELQRK